MQHNADREMLRLEILSQQMPCTWAVIVTHSCSANANCMLLNQYGTCEIYGIAFGI